MQLKKIKNYYDQLIRIDRHKNYLWDRIYNLRGEITDYVLVNHNRRNVDKHWKALKVKAKLIQKYSLKLREYDSVRINEDFKEIRQ
jgi:hypothetical protein